MAYLRRKVDQQLGFCSDLLNQMTESSINEALRSAVCWQLEQTLCFYLLEVVRASGNRQWSHHWTLDKELLMAALKSAPSIDTQELVDLSEEPGSWLADLLEGLQNLRRVEEPASLKAELFQSDAMENNSNVIVRSGAIAPRVLEWVDLTRIAGAMHSIIQRQRLGREEY